MSEQSDRAVGLLVTEIENLKSSANDRDEADALAVDLHESVNLIFSRAAAREEARRKKVEWEAIVPQCRAAQERFHKLNAEAEKQNDILAEARHKVDNAESRLNLARDARPSPYPTPKEISDWENLCKKLENSLEEARAHCRAANTGRGEMTRELLQARNDFTSLMFRERNLRGQQPVLAYQPVELSGVR
jgi:chromosome segregation ATPase